MKKLISIIVALLLLRSNVVSAKDLKLPTDNIVGEIYEYCDKKAQENPISNIISNGVTVIGGASIISSCTNGKVIKGDDLHKMFILADVTNLKDLKLPEKYSDAQLTLSMSVINTDGKEQKFINRTTSPPKVNNSSNYIVSVRVSTKKILSPIRFLKKFKLDYKIDWKITFKELDGTFKYPTTIKEIKSYGGYYVYDSTIISKNSVFAALAGLYSDAGYYQLKVFFNGKQIVNSFIQISQLPNICLVKLVPDDKGIVKQLVITEFK